MKEQKKLHEEKITFKSNEQKEESTDFQKILKTQSENFPFSNDLTKKKMEEILLPEEDKCKYELSKIDDGVLCKPPLSIEEFQNFTDKIQDLSIHQPLKNITYTNGHDTWHESRKSSENFMETDDMNTNTSQSNFISHNTVNSISSVVNLNTLNNISLSSYSQSYNNFSNKNSHSRIKLDQESAFKIPRSYKFDPTAETCSNMNFYNKPFIPKPKAKEKLKNIVPFLKDFKPKFLKKENIDKKILRKFRNYVKIVSKSEKEILEGSDKFFWKNFVTANLLPPMKYEDSFGLIQFKSFNTKYLLWLFSKEGCVKLFQDFSLKFVDQILGDFITSYDLLNNKEEPDIVDKLKYYIEALPEIYFRKNFNEIDSTVSFTTKLHSEELLADYIGCDYPSTLNAFSLNNFCETSYPRCGPKLVNRDYFEDYEDYESYCNMADNIMNKSFDSVATELIIFNL